MVTTSHDVNKQYAEEVSGKVLKQRFRRELEKDVDYNPTSVEGLISIRDMGSKVTRERPVSQQVSKQKKSKNNRNDVLFTHDSLEPTSYEPTNEKNAHLFDLLMADIHKSLPDASHDVIVSAADAVLELLKQEDLTNKEKLKEIRELLDYNLSDIEFNDLLMLSKKIDDYLVNDQAEKDNEEGDYGVAVVFDDSDEEDQGGDVEVDEGNLPARGEPTITDNETKLEDDEVIIENKGVSKPKVITEIPLGEIDQFYVQKQLSEAFPNEDPSIVYQKKEKFMEIISSPTLSIRDVENELMDLMDYDHFEVIKSAIENRWRIVFRIKLLEATEDDARETILNEMRNLNLMTLIDEINEFESLTSARPERKRKLGSEKQEVNKKPKTLEEVRQPRIVDLEALSFDLGGNLMTTTRVKLPHGSFQQSKKLYDIITIPAPSPPPSLEEMNESLVSISMLPEWAQLVFPSSETRSLNRIQSKIYPKAFKSDDNILLCAPTGAGKTNAAMLTVLRAIENNRDPKTGQIDLNAFKIVYVAPLKALVQEQVREFQRRLTPNYGIVVNELTGDSSLSRQQINETQMLITTPEKWDVITRKGLEREYVKLVQLLIIDEIHLLHDDRGPVIESLVSRTLRNSELSNCDVRLVGLSATLPNYEDVAQFLRVDLKGGLFYFDASYRPCPLEQQFIGIKERKAIKKVNAMNEACYEKLLNCIEQDHQMIIFVHSRKETHKTANWLISKLKDDDKLGHFLKGDVGSNELLSQEADLVTDKNLKNLLPNGFGIHHAGLRSQERATIEDLFAGGHIRALISTATLAWGVNLPAHTVVIKGTDTYNPEKGAWVQLSPQDILQMLGRAGRPRYDKTGEGVIITSHEEIQYYLAILNQQLPIESQLVSKLVDNLNAEIVLGTVKSRTDAIDWLGYTYLYIRMLKSPALYHVGADYADDKNLYWKRLDLVHTALSILNDKQLVVYNLETGAVKSTELGRISSYFYISYDTIHSYNKQLRSWITEIDLLKIFATSGEFKYIPVRREETFEIQKLLEKCPYPIKEGSNDPLAKVNVLLQTYISKLKLDGFALMADMVYIIQSAGRLFRAIHEIALRKGWSALSKITLNFCKMIERRMWLTDSPFRQFGLSAPSTIVKSSENSHLPWISYFHLSEAELAEAINFKGNGKRAYELLEQFPKIEIRSYVQPITSGLLRIQAQLLPNWKWNSSFHGTLEKFLLLVEDCNGDKILYWEDISIKKDRIGKDHYFDITVPVLEPREPNYLISILSEKWLQAESSEPIIIEGLKLPKSFPYTALHDLQLVLTDALENQEFKETFQFKFFNKFQTQTFHPLYNSNENIFIGASKGCGKTICAELAILNLWGQNKGRAIYVQPSDELVNIRLRTWREKYAKVVEGSKSINRLTGDTNNDLRIISSSHLILATPEQIEFISRRWRQRKVIQSLELIICDDVHAIGDGTPRGIAYENFISRMRMMSSILLLDTRFVILSNPVSSSKDMGDWLGCLKQNVYNFDPKYRYRNIEEIRLQTSIPDNNGSLMTSLLSPAYECFKSFGTNDRTLLFVSSEAECIRICFEFIDRAFSDKRSLLRSQEDEIKPYIDRVNDRRLKDALLKGVGLFFDEMSAMDKLITQKLFESDYLTILVAAKGTCNYCPVAPNVIVLGAQEFDYEESRYVDYSIATLLEIVGCCFDDSSKTRSVIYTRLPKLDYYNNFLNEAMPLESFFEIVVHSSLLAEIGSRTIKTKQDCLDWITYSYFYRRLLLNPGFYGVRDVSHMGVSLFLSELVEKTLHDLEDSGFIEIENPDDESDDDAKDNIAALNETMIACYYNISYSTIKTFSELGSRARMRTILEVISFALEFQDIQLRENESRSLSKINSRVPFKINDPDLNSKQTKIFILLQAHFSRIKLSEEHTFDLHKILKKVLDILYACVDTLSSEGHLSAINCIDICQMVVQGIWNKESPLKQVPYFDDAVLKRCKDAHVETVFDIMALEDDERDDILRLDDEQLNDVAEFVNHYPNVDMSYRIDMSEPCVADEPKDIIIRLERDEEIEDLSIVSSRFPFKKPEVWWVVIGDPDTRQIYAISKTTINKEEQELKMDFAIPNAGHHKLTIWCMCDSYLDADKEISFDIDVNENQQ